jgi:FkbM family methyltransferase
MFNREEYINSPIEIEFELINFFDKTKPLTIFDIGACEAEDSIRYANLFPNATVYAFEPRTDNCSKAKELIKKYNKKNIILENIALSDKNGTAEFYLSEGEPEGGKDYKEWDFGNKSSSLLPPSEEMQKHTSWLQFNKKIEVETIRLESYTANKNIIKIDFAHIDVQGAELMVLEGAASFLKQIKMIWLEVEAIQLYKNQPLKNDVANFMQLNNFVNILDTVNEVSGDQLYVNLSFFSNQKIQNVQQSRKKKSLATKLKSFLNFKK